MSVVPHPREGARAPAPARVARRALVALTSVAWLLACARGRDRSAGGVRPPDPEAAAEAAADSAFVRAHYAKREVRIPMRDGVRLFTAVYVPKHASPARRSPILLYRTPFSVAPYGPDAYPRTLGPNRFMLREGYIVVLQDVRGRYLSEGDFGNVRPVLPDSVKARDPRAADEATDTYDTIAWLLRNVPDHNGRVGQWGISYAGFYASLGMLSRHPALVASSPQAPVTDLFFEDFHHNGALTQGYFYAYPVFGVPRPGPTTDDWWMGAFERVAAYGQAHDYASQLALGPLKNTTARFYRDNTFWRDVIAHPNDDAFWQARGPPGAPRRAARCAGDGRVVRRREPLRAARGLPRTAGAGPGRAHLACDGAVAPQGVGRAGRRAHGARGPLLR